MPTVAEFEGIKIEFYFNEHPPPHFHARYAEHIVQIELETLTVLKGSLPRPQLQRVIAWASPRQEELLLMWLRCAQGNLPGRIA